MAGGGRLREGTKNIQILIGIACQACTLDYLTTTILNIFMCMNGINAIRMIWTVDIVSSRAHI